jgi:hypothetical protein
VIKVSVLQSGELLLDGRTVSLGQLESALRDAAKANETVGYYREAAAGEPPAIAMAVMELVVRNKLPVRLFTTPDFSLTALDSAFDKIRESAAGGKVVILRPDSKTIAIRGIDPAQAPPAARAAIERMLPSAVKRNIAVLGDTSWTMAAAPDLQTANAAIPFFGMLLGFSGAGHAVWVIGAGTMPLLLAAARDADVLIVDDARLTALPNNWSVGVAAVMRSRQILQYDRSINQLRKL